MSNNRFLLFFAIPIIFIIYSAKVSGIVGVIVYILESFVGVILLEIVNYVSNFLKANALWAKSSFQACFCTLHNYEANLVTLLQA